MGKSQVISFRLYADDPAEGAALEILEALQRDGFTPRQIITDALLHRDGVTPEMFRRRYDAPMPTLDISPLEALLRDFLGEIKEAVRTGELSFSDNVEEDHGRGGGNLTDGESRLIASYKKRVGVR